MDADQRAALLTLATIPGIGPARLDALLAACETPLGAHSAPLAFLRTVPGVTAALASAIKSAPLEAGRRVLEQATRLGARVLTRGDKAYPELLRHIPEPPAVLYALGDLSLLARPAVAVVGSRDHSPYGGEVCRAVAATAAAAGALVVSGMARGLDALAHGAALDIGGATAGVLGNGLGVVYPAANRALYARVAERGVLLTEHPPGERPNAGSFPRRNRLISGLARLTVVVEAAVGSGALITAGAALEQGREVVAVPGPITSPTSAGANRLIRDGAAPLLEPTDVLEYFPELSPTTIPTPTPFKPLPPELTPAERGIAELLDGALVHPDQLAERAGRPVGEVLALLCGLELTGVVEQHPGRLFRRV